MLRLRFGLEDGRPRTLEEVGKEFDVTRERIRQIEAKALRKLLPSQPEQKTQGFSGLTVIGKDVRVCISTWNRIMRRESFIA